MYYLQIIRIKSNTSILSHIRTLFTSSNISYLFNPPLILPELLDQFVQLLLAILLRLLYALRLKETLMRSLHLYRHVFLLAFVVPAEVLLPRQDCGGV